MNVFRIVLAIYIVAFLFAFFIIFFTEWNGFKKAKKEISSKYKISEEDFKKICMVNDDLKLFYSLPKKMVDSFKTGVIPVLNVLLIMVYSLKTEKYENRIVEYIKNEIEKTINEGLRESKRRALSGE